MHNIHGKDGIINRTGLPGASSNLIDCRNEDFWDDIEDGIRSTVKAFVSHGFYTVSSCQGHASSCSIRCISIIDERTKIRWIQQAVAEINMSNPRRNPIRYALLDKNPSYTLYSGIFSAPKIIDIALGHFLSEDTVANQNDLENYIITHTCAAIEEPLDPKLVDPYINNDAHYDVYS